MFIIVEGYRFTQPKLRMLVEDSIPNVDGVYIIWQLLSNGEYRMVDCGVSHKERLGERVRNHNREKCWNLNGGRYISYLATPYPFSVEREIRSKRPWLPCGKI